jgi:hypothetical protein
MHIAAAILQTRPSMAAPPDLETGVTTAAVAVAIPAAVVMVAAMEEAAVVAAAATDVRIISAR